MASFAGRTHARPALLVAGLVAVAGCTGPALQAPPLAPAIAGLPVQDPGVVLPAGAGRDILLDDCTACHDLGGLELFGNFYTRDDWHALVVTMVSHGAALDAAEVELLADYLSEHFSPD